MNHFRTNILKVARSVGNSGCTIDYRNFNGHRRCISKTTVYPAAEAMVSEFKDSSFFHRFLQTLGKKLPSNHKYHRHTFASNVLDQIRVATSVTNNGRLQLVFSIEVAEYYRSLNVIHTLLNYWAPNAKIEIQPRDQIKKLPLIQVQVNPEEVNGFVCGFIKCEDIVNKDFNFKTKAPEQPQAKIEVSLKDALAVKVNELATRSMNMALDISNAEMNLNRLKAEYDKIKTQIGILSQAKDIV
ncbi:hypothetical protein NCTGTJJY_CDS0079 [Serratia phage 92A1]|nr:hypothetical protein NCTGTJJY_CDS0079 [Serratia phage 92A1]